ncbi:MAG: tetratricopeptide repeat protein [Exilibacterium sp.]
MNAKSVFFATIAAVLIAAVSPTVFSHGAAQDRLHRLEHEIEHHPDDPALYVKRGRVYRDAEQWDNALNDFVSALKIDRQYHEARYWQGEALMQKGDLRGAEQVLKKYITQVPDSPSGNRTLSQVLMQLHKYPQAAYYLDQTIQHDSRPPPQVFLERARALANITPLPTRRIVAGLKKGLVKHPRNVVIINELVRIYELAEQRDSALAAIDLLPSRLRDSPKWLNRRAQIEMHRGHRKRALDLYRQTIAKIDALPEQRRRLPAFVHARQAAESGISKLNL